MKTTTIPKDGLEGLKENWKSDSISGFLIFLIAMPLCLAISKASGFPPIAGIYTAIIGGIIVSFFMGARVTIKGPAAGLIAIAVGAVEELGKGDNMRGYQLTLAVIVVAAVIQIIFGFIKAGKLGDFFPSSAVHGMLAAIGIIIISKQLPVLFGEQGRGKEPLELLADIPYMFANMNPEVAFIGVVSLLILFLLPTVKHKFIKLIPAPMVVLLVAIPLGLYYGFQYEHDYTLAEISYHIIPANLLVQLPDTFLGGITFPDFSELLSITSIKYIIMFALVGSLESILSAKAIDILDPFKRKSDLNKDILAVGTGNLIAGFVGGLPMISEIVRSSANINNGARTRWSNFFHGMFLLVFVALAAPLIEMIPNAALAAMLIYTGFRLASPQEFQKTWKIGWDQLLIFIITIIITLTTDLLLGIFAGLLTEFVMHSVRSASFLSLFKSNVEIVVSGNEYTVKIKDAAVFSNYLSFKKSLDMIKPGKNVIFNFSDTKIIDHTFLEHLHHFEEDYHNAGGYVSIIGMSKHRTNSNHPLATRSHSSSANRIEFKLNSRQKELRDFAEESDFTFYPAMIKNTTKYKNFSVYRGSRIFYEENILLKYYDSFKIEVSDIAITEGAGVAGEDFKLTMIYLSDFEFIIPDFTLEPERFWTKLSEITSGKDIDFHTHEIFSRKYYLRGENEDAIRMLFHKNLIEFLEKEPDVHIESHRNKLFIYTKRELLSVDEIKLMLVFLEGLVKNLMKTPTQISIEQ